MDTCFQQYFLLIYQHHYQGKNEFSIAMLYDKIKLMRDAKDIFEGRMPTLLLTQL